jgi:hypothetical protein
VVPCTPVTLTTACRDWIFYYKECNRSSDIKNIVAPGTKCLYIEARLNNLDAANNSSPSFGNEPVSFVCINRDAQLDNGAIEPDGDLLRFRLVNPRTNTRISEVNDLNIFDEIEKRDRSLFVTLTYPHEVKNGDYIFVNNKLELNFFNETVFVAIKNGMHDTKGYVFYSPNSNIQLPERPVHISKLHDMILNHF